MKLKLILLNGEYAIYRFNSEAEIPESVGNKGFYSITKTHDEISVVCLQDNCVTQNKQVNTNWRILKIQGPLDFSMIGIIAEISGILKDNNISIFTISTYDTDYILIKDMDVTKAIEALKTGGHKIIYEN